jgi:hypothetical protein
VDASPEPRDLNRTIVDLAALLGLAGIVAGIVMLAPGALGFQPDAAIAAILPWIPVTLPSAVVVLAASLVDVGAGIVLARAIRGRPFEGLDEAVLQGFVASMVKDALLLGVFAGIGFFNQPLLIAVHVATLAAGALRLRPVLAPGAVPRVPQVTPFGVLISVAWSAPILLQLASPIVPFLDILPNHVAPAEHLRTFGTLTALTDTQSPIYGPSRILLGYTALLGTITTGSGLPAGVALAGFILPSTLLVGVAIHRLARAIGGADAAGWALLTFAMTTSLARLSDARATVIVLPLVAWSLAVLAERLAADPGKEIRRATRARLPDGVLVGLGLGSAILLHPVIGFLGATTVGIVVLVAPARAASIGIPALGTGVVMALPQAATMLGVPLPPIALVVAIGLAVAVGAGLHRAPSIGRVLVVPGRVLGVVAAVLAVILAGALIPAMFAGVAPRLAVVELSILAGAVSVALRAPASRNLVLWAALASGVGLAALTQLVPKEGSSFVGEALRFELPKTLQYWVPVFVAILAAGGLAALLRAERLPAIARGIGIVTFVGTAALPIRATPIDAYHLGEHRLSETLSIAMRWAEHGYWSGFPDSRYVVDRPRREILDAIRAEIEAGRIGPDTPILHVAGSFQQWIATPLGVFAGVTETDITPDAVVSIHTIGGRLRPMDDLNRLLDGCFPYALLEPRSNELPPGIRDLIVAAGYEPIFANGQGELFVLGGWPPPDEYPADCPH